MENRVDHWLSNWTCGSCNSWNEQLFKFRFVSYLVSLWFSSITLYLIMVLFLVNYNKQDLQMQRWLSISINSEKKIQACSPHGESTNYGKISIYNQPYLYWALFIMRFLCRGFILFRFPFLLSSINIFIVNYVHLEYWSELSSSFIIWFLLQVLWHWSKGDAEEGVWERFVDGQRRRSLCIPSPHSFFFVTDTNSSMPLFHAGKWSARAITSWYRRNCNPELTQLCGRHESLGNSQRRCKSKISLCCFYISCLASVLTIYTLFHFTLKRFDVVSFNDGQLEVIGIKSVFHISQIGAGLTSGVRWLTTS